MRSYWAKLSGCWQRQDICIIATGMMTVLAVEAARALHQEGIEAKVLNIHTIKPLDADAIRKAVLSCNGRVVVCEEANMFGGLSEGVASVLVEEDGIRFARVAIEDRFGQSGATSVLLEAYGITTENIVRKARSVMQR